MTKASLYDKRPDAFKGWDGHSRLGSIPMALARHLHFSPRTESVVRSRAVIVHSLQSLPQEQHREYEGESRQESRSSAEGSRNADPLTDAPGAHPVEAGIGAAIGGVLTGMAIGAVAGPVTAAVGAAIGELAGGYIGKDVGELIDPTIDDDYLRTSFGNTSVCQTGRKLRSLSACLPLWRCN